MKTLDAVRETLRWLMFGIVLFDSFMLYETMAALRSVSTYSRNSLVEQKLLSDMRDAECGQRGYLYSNGADQYTPQYYAGEAGVRNDMTLIKKYLGNDPDSGPVIAQLNKDVELKLNELSTTVEYFKQGNAAKARELFSTDAGLHYMQRIAIDVSILREQERERLPFRGLLP